MNVPMKVDDGWEEATGDSEQRMIKGTILRFSDWRWTKGKEQAVIKEGTQLVALGTTAVWVRWEDKKPVEYVMREAHRRMADREELSHNDQDEWPQGPDGRPMDPWQNTRLVYLIDAKTAEAYTFSTSSWGGRNAVAELADQISRMRMAHPGAAPIVELAAAEMPTKFGKKSKPVLKVVGWKAPTLTGEQDALPLKLEDKKRPPLSLKDEMDEEIPF